MGLLVQGRSNPVDQACGSRPQSRGGEWRGSICRQSFYLNHHLQERRDKADDPRSAIIFELEGDPGGGEPTDEANPGVEPLTHRRLQSKSLDELRRLARQAKAAHQ